VPKRAAVVRRVVPLILLVAAIVATLLYMQQKRRPRELVLSGTLEARTVNVGSLAGGRVTRVLVDEGSHVTAGQMIATLETDTIDRQIGEQQAAIDSARAQLAKGFAGPRREEISKAAAIAANDAVERRRQERLFRYGIVAKELAEDAATKAKASADDLRILQQGTRKEDLEALRAQLEQQQRHLATLQRQRAESEVRSTVNGIVQSFGLRPGDLVAPNQAVAEILEADQLWVRVYVPETELGLVRVDHPVQVHVDTYPNVSFHGHIATVSGQGEYTPRNVQTRAQRAEQVFGAKVLIDADPRLHAGMAADVDLGVKGSSGQ
jgi:HlyD family secretion protein